MIGVFEVGFNEVLIQQHRRIHISLIVHCNDMLYFAVRHQTLELLLRSNPLVSLCYCVTLV